MKKVFIFICILTMGAFFSGCGIFEKDVTITSITAYGDKTEFDESFKLSDINVKVTKSDGTNEVVPLSAAMLSEEDLAKFQTTGQHTVKVAYLGVETTFEIKIVGEKGADGKEVELQVADGYIQWRYKGINTWTNLVSLSLLSGSNGTNGKEVELQIVDEYIKWRYKGDETWVNLIQVSSLKGLNGEDGADGKEVELQVNEGLIEWRYKGDLTWVKLIEVSKLMGPKGADGSEVELQLKDNFIQYKLKNATVWTNLISLDLIRGIPGPVGPQGPASMVEISEDGYWVINGYKTTTRASVITPEYQKYTVTFDANGGVMPEGFNNVMENIVEGSIIDLPIPTHQDLTFMGWYIGDEPHNHAFDEFDTVHKDMTLIARWDYTILNLEKFLNITKSNSYTLDIYYKKLSNYENREWYLNAEYYIDNNGHLNVYELSKSIDLDNLYEENYLDYYLYTEEKDYNVYYYNDQWSFYGEEFDEYYYIDLSYLQLSRFTRQNESHIYQYPVGRDIVHAMNEYFEDDFYKSLDIGESYVYVDLKEMKIIVNLEFYYDGRYTTEYNEFTFSNVGSAITVFPMEYVKKAVKGRLDLSLEDHELEYATEETRTAFLARYNEMIDIIDNENDLEELKRLGQDFSNELYDFPLILDEVAYYRSRYVNTITSYFEEKCYTATQESIEDMEEIFSLAVYNINNLTLIEGQWILESSKLAIDEAYVEDEFKVSLNNYKDEVWGDLQNLAETINRLVEGNPVFRVFDIYELQFIEAMSYDEVDRVAELIINEWKTGGLIYNEDKLYGFKDDLVGEYYNLYRDGLNGFGNYPIELETAFVDGRNLIYSATSYFEALERYENQINILGPMVLQCNKDYYLSRLERDYNNRIIYAKDSDMESILGFYNTYQSKINEEVDFNKVQIHYNDCSSEFLKFGRDEVKYNIPIKLNSLAVEYNAIIPLCTDASLAVINTIYESTINLIRNSKTLEDINSNYDTGIIEMKEAKVVDGNKKYLDDYKKVAYAKMDYLIDRVNVYVDSYDYETVDDLFNQYVLIIEGCASLEEVDEKYDLWYEAFLNINVRIKLPEFISRRESMISEINGIINIVNPETEAAYLVELELVLDEISETYHVIKVVKAYLDAGQFSYEYLTSLYNEYYRLVDTTKKAELDNQYHTVYLSQFGIASNLSDKYSIISNFKAYAETLLTIE